MIRTYWTTSGRTCHHRHVTRDAAAKCDPVGDLVIVHAQSPTSAASTAHTPEANCGFCVRPEGLQS